MRMISTCALRTGWRGRFGFLTTVTLCLAFILLTVSSASALDGSPAFPEAASGQPSVLLNAAAVSNGWPILKYVLNDAGSLVFGGGDFQGEAQGIVYTSPARFLRVASLGDPVPGVAGSIFAGFPLRNSFGDLALDQEDNIVFSARTVVCSSGSELDSCLDKNPYLRGLFRFSQGQINKIVLEGDAVPGREGYIFSSFSRIWPNDLGDIAFLAYIRLPGQQVANGGLFLYSGGEIHTIAVDGDPEPRGSRALSFNGGFKVGFGNQRVLTFYLGVPGGIFRYANGPLTEVVARGDPAPDGGNFQRISEAACNSQGDVVFNAGFGPQPAQQGLFLLRGDDSMIRIVTDGDPTPAGGTFSLWYEYTTIHGGAFTAAASLSPALNDHRTVLFQAPIKGIQPAGGLFVYDGTEIRKIVVQGDPRPDHPELGFDFAAYQNGGQPFFDVAFALNNAGTVVFNTRQSGLFYALGGRITALATSGEPAPVIDGNSTFQAIDTSFLLSNTDQVAFQASLCCGSDVAGIFLARPRSPDVPNGSFENPGQNSILPAAWSTAWTNFGSGEAYRFDVPGVAAFDGSSVLRLHVGPGGGAVFALSDPFAVIPDMDYLVESRMRFYFDDASDVSYFSVIQFDNSGNQVGFDNIRGLRGDSFWTWVAKRLLIHTAPDAAFLRYRFGLSSMSERYLDVDAVR